MSQQDRRIFSRPYDHRPQQPQLPSKPWLPPTTLPLAFANYIPQNLTIHIDSSGRKSLINPQGQKSMIHPMACKFFGKYFGLSDKVDSNHKEAYTNLLKQHYCSAYDITPQSKIFNYNVMEIHLIAQLYQELIPQQQKREEYEEHNWLKGRYRSMNRRMLLYSIFLLCSRHITWWRLTANRSLRLGIGLCGGSLWFNAYIEERAFEMRTIVYHTKAYENVVRTYQNDYKIVY